MKSLTLPEFDTASVQPKVVTAGNESADPYDRFYAIKDKQSLQVGRPVALKPWFGTLGLSQKYRKTQCLMPP